MYVLWSQNPHEHLVAALENHVETENIPDSQNYKRLLYKPIKSAKLRKISLPISARIYYKIYSVFKNSYSFS